MSHLDEGTLHAMLDGELEPNEMAEIQAHLASCSSCGLRLREVREFLDEADRLIASVEMDGAAAAPMRRATPSEATPERARLEPPRPEPARSEPGPEPVRPEPARSEPVRSEPPRAEPVRHEAPVRPERSVPVGTTSDASAPRRPDPPPRPRPRPVPDRPVGKESWNAPPPPLLMPDNESAADRRMRRVRKYGWAAMIAVLVGAGFVGTRLREPPQAAFEASVTKKPADAIVSPEETARPAAPTSDSAPSALATRPPSAKEEAATTEAAPKSLARADAPKDASKEAPKNAGKVADEDSGKSGGEATEEPDEDPAAGGLALARQRPPRVGAPPPDTSASADEAAEDSSSTEDLATVRARAADALADLDRERRRNEAAAATANLDAQRRRRPAAQPAGAAPAVTRAAQVAAPPPTPPTLEQRAQVYLRIGLDEAARQLGGPAHVIEGMSAMFIGLAQGVAVPGADATRPVVRMVYQDSQGRLIMLDQQRLRPGQPTPQGSPLGWVLGETAIWLHGELAPDLLRTYRPRVR
jgi:putative zinc finger protein